MEQQTTRRPRKEEQEEGEEETAAMKHITSVTGVYEMNSVQQDEVVVKGESKAEQTTTTMKNEEDEDLVNVASSSNGARVLFATDEWFATADNLINDTQPPTFDANDYCEQGKVMDGWETRRRRLEGHDWCLIKLANNCNNSDNDDDDDDGDDCSDCCVAISDLCRVDIDTAYFTGNQVPAISLEVTSLDVEEEATLVRQLPGAVERLLRHGKGIRGMGATPDQVEQAVEACNNAYCHDWTEILPRTPLQPGYEETRHHSFALLTNATTKLLMAGGGRPATHLKVNYFPDGGVARLRLWGRKKKSSSEIDRMRNKPIIPPPYMPITTGPRCTVISHSSCPQEDMLPSRQANHVNDLVELSSLEHGGKGVACSNHHYGEPQNLIQASLGRDMGDGWETARHPDRPAILVKNPVTHLIEMPNHLSDWCILKLGQTTTAAHAGISRIILDTKHFRGNYPESCKVEGALIINNDNDDDDSSNPDDDSTTVVEWFPLVERCKMSPDAEHVFDAVATTDDDKNKNNKDCSSSSSSTSSSKVSQIVNAQRPVSHVRVSIYPDGGLSRVRVYGKHNNNSKSNNNIGEATSRL